ncbi:MAG TPA: hypothetical protein VHQ43_01175 [Solirubrobacterales bacterium]|jgi:hypothetical protein|nr:hypothetical protein [Solirubrobacterales bacterium]
MRRALALLAAIALGLLVGRLSAPQPTSPPLATPRSPGPTREGAGGVGVGYAHSRAGAIAASARYQQAFTDAAILRPGELRARIEAVATPRRARAMLRANAPGAARLASGPFGQGIGEGVPSAYLGVPVAYRLLRYSPRRALIRTWGFTVLGNASTLEPSAYFGLSRTELVWREGDWKIADTRASFGPTPRLATPRRGGEGFALIDLLGEMRPYGIAP